MESGEAHSMANPWRSSVFRGLLPPIISEVKKERSDKRENDKRSEPPPLCTALRDTARILSRSRTTTQPPRGGETGKEETQPLWATACEALNEAASLAQELHLCDTGKMLENGAGEMQSLLEKVVGRVGALKPGECVVVPGGLASGRDPGWGSQADQPCSVLYVVERLREEEPEDGTKPRYSFAVCNTGHGLDYHAYSAQALPVHNYCSVLRVLVDDACVVTGESLWWYLITLARKSACPGREAFRLSNPAFLYEIAFPFVAGASSVDEAVRRDGESCHGIAGAVDGSGRGALFGPRHLHVMGPVLSCLRYLLRGSGEDLGALVFDLRIGMMQEVKDRLNDLRSSSAVTHSFEANDLSLVEMLSETLAREAAKRPSSGTNLGEVRKLVQSSRELAGKLFDEAAPKDEGPGVGEGLHAEASAPLLPFTGFELIADSQPVHFLAGVRSSVLSSSLYVDLRAPEGSISTLEALFAALLQCEERCAKLRTKASFSPGAVAVQQILALIESFVFKAAPLPDAATCCEFLGSPKSPAPPWDFWRSSIVDGVSGAAGAAKQRHALKSLKEIADHYLSAALSDGAATAYDDACRSICMGGILCLFDCIARLEDKSPGGSSTLQIANLMNGKHSSNLKTRFYPSTVTFRGERMHDIMAASKLAAPEAANARRAVLSYLGAWERSGALPVFDFVAVEKDWPNAKMTRLDSEDKFKTFAFLKQALGKDVLHKSIKNMPKVPDRLTGFVGKGRDDQTKHVLPCPQQQLPHRPPTSRALMQSTIKR